MCGIAGIFYTDDSRVVESSELKKMTSVLVHRGPDEQGYYVDRSIGLGHRRLKVVDLITGKQPIFNENKDISIVFNGEIYNHIQLRTQLLKLGHKFETNSDTEVIVHAYEEYGQKCLERLEGMFAFTIWDGRIKKLFAARDRLGIKPLYYYFDGKRFIFASEIQAILQVPSLNLNFNYLALDDYLTFGYIPAPKTIYNEIHKLPAGYSMIVSKSGLQLDQYWDISFKQSNDKSEHEYAHDLKEVIKQTVHKHLYSDVNIGAFLSGGLDSSVMVAEISDAFEGPVKTASVGFSESEFDELPYSKIVRGYYNTDGSQKIVSAEDSFIISDMVGHFGEPFADPAVVPNYFIANIARENVTVCISGDGGDELFGGYARFLNYVNNCGLNKPSADTEYLYSKSIINVEFKPLLYNDNFKNKLSGYDPYSLFNGYLQHAKSWDPLCRVQYLEMKTYLADDILTKVDITSMANSLEVRVPFLDHKFVEYSATIPSKLKIKDGIRKYILNKAYKNVLPREIINREKMGLMVPLNGWFKNSLKNLFEDKVLDKCSFSGQLLDLNNVAKIWGEHQQGKKDHFRKLWALLVLELWGRRFAL